MEGLYKSLLPLEKMGLDFKMGVKQYFGNLDQNSSIISLQMSSQLVSDSPHISSVLCVVYKLNLASVLICYCMNVQCGGNSATYVYGGQRTTLRSKFSPSSFRWL